MVKQSVIIQYLLIIYYNTTENSYMLTLNL